MTTFEDSFTIGELKIKALAQNPLEKKYKVLTEGVTESYSSEDKLCGEIEYKVLNQNYQPAPSLITVEYIQGDPEFKIVVNARNFATETTMSLIL